MAQYTITGYDASAHMSEETRKASIGAAWGMVMSVLMSLVLGFVLLVALTFAVPDVAGTLGAGVNAVVYIWSTSLNDAWAASTKSFRICVASSARPRRVRVPSTRSTSSMR